MLRRSGVVTLWEEEGLAVSRLKQRKKRKKGTKLNGWVGEQEQTEEYRRITMEAESKLNTIVKPRS